MSVTTYYACQLITHYIKVSDLQLIPHKGVRLHLLSAQRKALQPEKSCQQRQHGIKIEVRVRYQFAEQLKQRYSVGAVKE